jgi:hypothetical protein
MMKKDHSQVKLYKHNGLASVDQVMQQKRNVTPVGRIYSKIGFPTPFSPLK